MKIVLIVGPSGAGKDTLLRGARAHFAGARQIGFVRRYVTRPPDSHEDNYFIDLRGFITLQAAGFFLSSWQAHSNHYGVARHILTESTQHRLLVCSISRSAITDFERVFSETITINVSVPEDIMRSRLRLRGRESHEQIDQRLQRARQPVAARKLLNFDNSEELSRSTASFVQLLNSFC